MGAGGGCVWGGEAEAGKLQLSLPLTDRPQFG